MTWAPRDLTRCESARQRALSPAAGIVLALLGAAMVLGPALARFAAAERPTSLVLPRHAMPALQSGALLGARPDPEAVPVTRRSEGPGDGAEGPSDVLRQLMQRNPVVARVNGRELRWAEIISSAGDLAITQEEEARALFPALLERVIDLELLSAAAREEGFHQDQQVQAQVRQLESALVSHLYLERQVALATSHENLRTRYLELVSQAGARPEVHARHILVKTRAEAEEHIGTLNGGGDFGALARKYSIGPSAARGGDLGFFDPARMVPAFAEATLGLAPGSYTRAPVETPFGWHVIELVDLRLEGFAPFAEMEEALREQAARETMRQVMARLRGAADIEILTGPPFSP